MRPPTVGPLQSVLVSDDAGVQGDARRLEVWFRGRGPALIAYSGGVDSALVAYAARRVLGRATTLAVIADSPSMPRSELAAALDLAARHDIPVEVAATREGEVPGYVANGPDRCYWCKQELYGVLRDRYAGGGFDLVLNGTNADDPGEWRPGLRAAAEYRVASPLLESGLGKAAVRRLSRALGLEVWDKPEAPCLASRIPYGQAVTPEKLARIEAAEAVLRREGFRIFRVRHLDGAARIEIGAEELGRLEDPGLEDRLRDGVRAAGFPEAVVDHSPFRSGRLNDTLDLTPLTIRGRNGG